MKRLITMIFVLMAIAIGTMAENAICVYRNDGNHHVFHDSEITSMKCTSTTFIVVTTTHTFNIPISTIDSVAFEEPLAEPQQIDLGLSVKWADFNVGAAKSVDMGGLYGWADPAGIKTSTSLNDYPGSNPPESICGGEYDIARAKFGGVWRLPTKDEFTELLNKCTWTWAAVDGVNGMKVSATNGNSIFLPAAGCRNGNAVSGNGTIGNYWSGTRHESNTDDAYRLLFNNAGRHYWENAERYYGQSVRAVNDVSVTTGEANDINSGTATISGNVKGAVNARSKVEIGVIYNTDGYPDITGGTKVKSDNTADGDFSVALTGLAGVTTYTYCAYMAIDGKFFYGERKSFSTKEYDNSTEAVDLGLSVKWAKANIGAKGVVDYGGRYGWADPTGETTTNNVWDSNFNWISSLYGGVNPPSNISATKYDLSRSKNGGNWRLPTSAEIQELIDKCTWQWTEQDGVKGMKVTATNGNSIFLPATGKRDGSAVSDDATVGNYWSGTLNSNDKSTAFSLSFSATSHSLVKSFARCYGLSIRPVEYTTTITTGASSGIGVTEADISGTAIGIMNAHNSVEIGMKYGTNPSPKTDGAVAVAKGEIADGVYTVALSGLAGSTTYYYCAYMAIDGNIYYGDVNSFTTNGEGTVGEAVDLGLNVKWANHNVGATNPEDNGGWYGWGDPTGTKRTRNDNDYPSATYSYNISGTANDIASVKWGNGWRMPTKVEIDELISKCTFTWISFKGVNGYKVTGTNGNSIFIPASGVRDSLNVSGEGAAGNYWSGSANYYGYSLTINSNRHIGRNEFRHFGLSVRPVIGEYSISAVTGSASNITQISATITGTVSGTLTPHNTSSWGVIYSTQPTGVKSGTKIASTSSGDGTFSLSLTGFIANTTYYYCTYLMIDDKYYYGDINSFATSKYVLQTGDAVVPSQVYAELNGSVSGIFSSNSKVSMGIVYGTNSNLDTSNGINLTSSSIVANRFQLYARKLLGGTLYYYRTYLCVDGIYYYGDLKNFTTKEYIVQTGDSVITMISAKLSGSVSGEFVSGSVVSVGVVYGENSLPTAENGTMKSSSLTGAGDFTLLIEGLNFGTTYYYRTYLCIDGRYIYGNAKKFTTIGWGTVGTAIDLGLSVKWASWNIGATKPEEYGGYYGWADPTGTKTSKNVDDYPSANPPSEISGTEYDIARTKWGGNWRLPTKVEMEELVNSCTWTWTTQNGVNGYKVAGKNGNSIFLPAAGGRNGTGIYDVGASGFYWSGTLYEWNANSAYSLHFFYDNNGPFHWVECYYRNSGFTVRPVVK